MSFPVHRLRRLRRGRSLRRLVAETTVTVDDLIQPFFVVGGEGVRRPISSMPGVDQISVDVLVEEVREIADLGIGGAILFGIPEEKDPVGSPSWSDDGIVQRALRALREAVPAVVRIADLCFCEYTDHGHCGVVEGGELLNDPSLTNLARQAVSLAESGADVLAPSGMLDGMVGAIRAGLDEAGHHDHAILSYAAKYSSGFYGPFREAAESAPAFGDRASYQMDPANAREAMREVRLDIEEGADLVMVKPALAYLDVIRRVREEFEVPVAAYNVSGEYSMLCAAAERGWIDRERVRDEILLSIKRAGADLILTYFAREVAGAGR